MLFSFLTYCKLPCFVLQFLHLPKMCAVRFADIMVGMGYSREEIHESLTRMRYDEITATYLLLGRKPTEVSRFQVLH